MTEKLHNFRDEKKREFIPADYARQSFSEVWNKVESQDILSNYFVVSEMKKTKVFIPAEV